MSPARVERRWQALCVATLGLAPIAARADLWSIENSASSRLEWNDNAALAHASPGSVNTLSLSNALNASRQLENSVTRMKADITALRQQGAGGQDRIDGQLALTQLFSDPLNSLNLAAQYSQDFNDVVRSADVTVGQGRRRTTLLSAGWSRALSERLSASTQLSVGRTAYGRALSGAVGFRDTALSGGVSYALSEIASLSLQASRSGYRAADDRNRSTTDAVNLSLAGAISDRSSGSVGLGAYRTASEAQGARLACPLATALCEAGLVPFVIVSERFASARRGLQFSAAVRYQLDPTTDASFSVARQQLPSGAGVLVRNDSLSAGINRSFSPTLSGALNYARSRSTLHESAGAARPGHQTLSLSLSKQLAPALSLQAGYQRSESDSSGHGAGARSNSVSVTLKYDWSRFDASR
ncbi:MAG: hypothetical protein V4569_08150 [Pseudomonadota bacterium]